MANHAKRRSVPKGVWIGSAATAAAAILVTVGILLVNNGVLAAFMGLFSRSPSSLVDSSTLPPVESAASAQPDPEPEPEPVVFRRPDKLSGVRLTAGVDYLTGGKESADAVKAQLDAAVTAAKDWGFNTLLLPVTYKGKALFETGALEAFRLTGTDGAVFDPVAYLLAAARAENLYVYGVLDLRVGAGWDPTKDADAQSMRALAADAAKAYAMDGWLLENYSYPLKAQGNQEAFAARGNGRTMQQFMADSITVAVTETAATLRQANRHAYVGLLANAVWAHQSVDARGSKTAGVYEELTDGRADSLAWLDGKLFDFVMVKDDRLTGNASASFETVLNWWANACGSRELPLYVMQSADKAGAGEKGWTGDELASQYLAIQKTLNCCGNAFNSLTALQKHTAEGFITVLRQAMDGVITGEYTFKELTFSSPKKTTVTTDESKFSFLGSTDPHFPVTMNGEALKLTEKGGFAVDVTLKPGKNTFTFVSNGKTVTFTVTYTLTILKSVSPGQAMTMAGGSTVGFSAIARKGSKVTVAFNGKTYTMKASPLKAEEGADDPALSDFENYLVSVTLPAGKAGQSQKLGAATFTGTYNGLKETKKSGAITVKPTVAGDMIVVTNEYAETFNGNTVEDYSRPTNAYLPKGTLDVVEKMVSLGSTQYYLLGCGRRVYVKDVAMYGTNKKLNANSLNKQAVQVYREATVLRLDADWRIPYNLQLLPQKYAKLTDTPNYSINKYGQTTEYVDITFSYTDKVPSSAPDVSGSPLLSKAEWRKGNENTTVLRLYLKAKGQFYGYSVVWDGNTLQFSFKHPSGIGKNPSNAPLKGVRIVVDPGHGGKSSGTYGTIPGLYEKTLTLSYGKLLRDKLTALGATVVMTRTTDVNPDNPDMRSRTAHARNNGTDLLVSVHMNGVKGESASGCSIHYFNEYSYAVNRAVTDAMRVVEKANGTGNRSEPCAWSPFYLCRVHDCPAILIEYGFMTNSHNMELLNTPAYQEKIVQASVDGIVKYFKSLPTYSLTASTTTSTTTSTTSTASATTTTTAAPPPASSTDAALSSADARKREEIG